MFLQVITVMNVYFATINISIRGLNFKNPFAIVVMICCCCLNFISINVITVRSAVNCCIIHDISKSDVIHLLKNSALDDCGYI